jgi:hypothetical protein
MRNLVNRISVIVISIVLFGGGVANAEDTAKSDNIIKNGDFEKWEWTQIDSILKKILKGKKDNGENFGVEIQGFRVRRPSGFAHGVSGIMVEGESSYKGKSLFLENNSQRNTSDVIGLFCAFGNLLELNKKYEWEVHVKGKGKFQFNAWVYGSDKKSGKRKFLGCLSLIKVVPDDQWKKYSGTFIIDSNTDKYKNYLLAKKISCAIVVPAGTAVYVDNFSIREVNDSSKEKSVEKKK